MDLQDLAKRIDRLESIEAIKQLKATYRAICDHNPDRITSIFANDEWEGRGIGHAKGHAAIRELFVGFQQAISSSQHMVIDPVVEVNGVWKIQHLRVKGPRTSADYAIGWAAAKR